MAKKKITDFVEMLLAEFLEENGMELYNAELLKEGRDWFLRVYIDKTNPLDEEGNPVYVGTEDCELVSRYLSERLDEEDPIEQNYYLEVSSPGMDRQLLKPEHYSRYAGNLVDVKLYKAVDGSKNYTGELVGLIDNCVIIKNENNEELSFPLEQVAKTSLAVVF